MLKYLSKQTLQVVIGELSERLTQLEAIWKQDQAEETFKKWQEVKRYLEEARQQYEILAD